MKKILIAVVALFLIVLAAVGIAVATFDINKHRAQIESELAKATGRTVKLGGEIHIGLSRKGVTLSARDVAVGNPDWASRPNMAGIGLFDLKIGLLPLLAHQVAIDGLSIENADIQLETHGDQHNWNLKAVAPTPAAEAPAPTPAEAGKAGAGSSVALNITNLTIKNSQIALRGDDGKVTIFKADELTLGGEGNGVGVHFDGSFNNQPITLALKSNADPLTSTTSRPLDIDLTFANYHLTGKGKVDLGNKKANFDSYALTSRDTTISGHLAASWSGARPALQGTITSDHLAPDDLKMEGAADADTANKGEPAPTAKPSTRVFSDQPLALSALKTADVNFDVAINELPTGSVELKGIKTKLVINNGHLFLSPLTMALGAGTIGGQVNLDASGSPARLGTSFKVSDVDLTDLIKMGGAEAFLSGKVKVDINLSSSGNSAHDLASNLNGPINLISAGGDVISTASDKLSAGLAEILAPGTGGKNEGMNCLVARFNASSGVIRGNGILIDTVAATAAGYGDIDLRSETLNLSFHAKPKLVNVGGLLPPLHIGGTLKSPSTSVDATTVVENVSQMLLGGQVADGVPDVATQQGQNACAFTLDHPSASAPASKGGVVQDLAGKAGQQLKNLPGAGNLLKGIFGQ